MLCSIYIFHVKVKKAVDMIYVISRMIEKPINLYGGSKTNSDQSILPQMGYNVVF